jgi:hypothetical protein
MPKIACADMIVGDVLTLIGYADMIVCAVLPRSSAR